VARPTALLVVKLNKIGERENTPTRLVNKDAHDLYRILRAGRTDDLVAAFERLLRNDGSRQSTEEALIFLERLLSISDGGTSSGSRHGGVGCWRCAAAAASRGDCLGPGPSGGSRVVGRCLDHLCFALDGASRVPRLYLCMPGARGC
jgi:hypothetical protein